MSEALEKARAAHEMLLAARAEQERREAVAEIAVTGRELGEFADTPDGLKELRAAARAFLGSVRGQMVRCEAMGRYVEIRKRSISEMMHFSANPKKLKIIPAIVQIIATAKSPVREENVKPQTKSALAYYRLHNTVTLDGERVPVEVLLEEDAEGVLHYDFLLDRGAQRTKAMLDCSGLASASTLTPDHKSGSADEEIVAESGAPVNSASDSMLDAAGSLILNLFIEGEDSEAQAMLDSLSAIDRARTASALAVKVKQLQAGAAALERIRLARDIRELVLKLGGAAPESPENRILREIVAGKHDGESLAELFGMIQENIGQDDFDLQQAAVTHWAELEAGEKAGAVPARPMMKRMELARELLKIRAKIEKSKGGDAISAGVMLGRRATAIRRMLLGTEGASLVDELLTPGLIRAPVASEWEAAKDAPPARRVTVAAYLADIIRLTRQVARAEERLGLGASGAGWGADLMLELQAVIGSGHGPETADPIIDASIEVGKFGDVLRGELVSAISASERAKEYLNKFDTLEPELASKRDLAYSLVKSSHAQMLTLSRKAQAGEVTLEEYESARAMWLSATEAVYEPINDDIVRRIKSKQDEAKRAFIAVGRKVIDSLIEQSGIPADAADRWAGAQTITKAAENRLKKLDYPVAQVRADMAEFYRVTGGRAAAVRVDSKGDKRANATDIESHGKVGTINLGSSFDKRVLWHELAHHMEADPAAKLASSRFIRRRAVEPRPYTLRSLTGNAGYRKDEAAFKDHFFDAYVGKVYRDGITEVFSMGIESLSNPELLARRMADDPQTLEFVSGFVKQPFGDLARAHLGLREMMRELNEEAEEAKGDFVGGKIKALAATVDLIPDQGREWLADNPAAWMFEMKGVKQIGRFGDSGYWLLQDKVRDPLTWRKVNGFVIARNPGQGYGIERNVLATRDLEMAKACFMVWQKQGVLPRPDYMNEKFFRENPRL